MIEEGLRRAGVTGDLDAMLSDFLVHYEANIAADSRPFPGAVEALDRLLRRRGKARGVHQQARSPLAQAAARA